MFFSLQMQRQMIGVWEKCVFPWNKEDRELILRDPYSVSKVDEQIIANGIISTLVI